MARHSKVVFDGEVIAMTAPTEAEIKKGSFEVGVRFRVDRYWKGVKTGEIVIHTRLSCCYTSLEIGSRYFVYALGKDLDTGCTRTMRIDHADEDLRVLGIGKSFP
jgi:hypothetical protein